MEITHSQQAGRVQLKLKGRMDAAWSDHVGQALAECVRAGQHAIAVDMAEVDYISSAGIRVLVICARQLQGIQGRINVIHASDAVSSVLRLAGLQSLLEVPGEDAPAPPPGPEGCPVSLPVAGARAEVFDLDPDAALRPRWLGEATPWLTGAASDAGTVVELPSGTMAVGLGALGEDGASRRERFGELLAAAGAAICQPADGTGKPDYLLARAALTPRARLAYGIVAEGSFARLLRFDAGEQAPSVPLSVVAQACLEASGSDAIGMVGVAETAALVGAALKGWPAAADGARHLLAFPEIREWLSFTAEAAFAGCVSLIVGFAARGECGHGMPLVKPMLRAGGLFGHWHAAAFPYRPIRKGKVDLGEPIGRLFESESVLGVLHLLNDWREASGAGESRFLRGGCWFAPLRM